jgi:hypothetical protein
MNEVVDRLKNYDIGKGTQDKQKKILSRMLQLETSIYKKQFSKRRLSESGGVYKMLEEAGKLPEQGELNRDILRKYIDEPYPKEYEELIIEYYKKLSE